MGGKGGGSKWGREQGGKGEVQTGDEEERGS